MQIELSIIEDNLDEFLLNLKEDEKSENTLKKYKHDILCFIEFIKNQNKSNFVKNDFINYRNLLKNKGFAISSINGYVVIINKYLKFLNYENFKIRVLKVQRKMSVENVPTQSDYKRFLRAAKKNNMMDAYYIIQIISYSGIRVSEIKFITIESLKESKKDKCILVLNKGKYREIFIPRWLIRELLNFAKENHIQSGYLFPSPKIKDAMIVNSTIWRKLQKVAGLAKCNKKYAHPHGLRHFFGKEFLKQSNNDYRKLADYMGHNNPNTTQIYTQLSREEKAKEIENFKL